MATPCFGSAAAAESDRRERTRPDNRADTRPGSVELSFWSPRVALRRLLTPSWSPDVVQPTAERVVPLSTLQDAHGSPPPTGWRDRATANDTPVDAILTIASVRSHDAQSSAENSAPLTSVLAVERSTSEMVSLASVPRAMALEAPSSGTAGAQSSTVACAQTSTSDSHEAPRPRPRPRVHHLLGGGRGGARLPWSNASSSSYGSNAELRTIFGGR